MSRFPSIDYTEVNLVLETTKLSNTSPQNDLSNNLFHIISSIFYTVFQAQELYTTILYGVIFYHFAKKKVAGIIFFSFFDNNLR